MEFDTNELKTSLLFAEKKHVCVNVSLAIIAINNEHHRHKTYLFVNLKNYLIMKYYFNKTIPASFDDTIEKVTEVLKAEGKKIYYKIFDRVKYL